MRARMCSWDVVFVVLLIVTSKSIRMRGVGRRAVFPMFQPIVLLLLLWRKLAKQESASTRHLSV